MNNPPGFKIKQNRLVTWHRRAGLTAALFILILAITGLLLNHTSSLELGKHNVDSRLLQAWYGIELPDRSRHFKADYHAISQLDEQLFINGKPLLKQQQQLLGVAANKLFVALAFEQELLLVTLEGELIERITKLPGPENSITTIGQDNNNQLALQLGNKIFISDQELLNWQELTGEQNIKWSQPIKVETDFENQTIAAYQNQALSYERLLLDLHSGRLFGSWGPYLMDMAAMAMILLALSGLWRWCQGLKRFNT